MFLDPIIELQDKSCSEFYGKDDNHLARVYAPNREPPYCSACLMGDAGDCINVGNLVICRERSSGRLIRLTSMLDLKIILRPF